jgi:hypothetical protein
VGQPGSSPRHWSTSLERSKYSATKLRIPQAAPDVNWNRFGQKEREKKKPLSGAKLSREYCYNAQVQLRATFIVVPSSYFLPNRTCCFINSISTAYQQYINSISTVYAPYIRRHSDRAYLSVVTNDDENIYIYIYTVYIYIYIYITAIGLTPGGSNTAHIYIQTVHTTHRTEHI